MTYRKDKTSELLVGHNGIEGRDGELRGGNSIGPGFGPPACSGGSMPPVNCINERTQDSLANGNKLVRDFATRYRPPFSPNTPPREFVHAPRRWSEH